jgi:hypothetical protein
MGGDRHQVPELEMLDRRLTLTVHGFLAKIELFLRKYLLKLGYIVRGQLSKRRKIQRHPYPRQLIGQIMIRGIPGIA